MISNDSAGFFAATSCELIVENLVPIGRQNNRRVWSPFWLSTRSTFSVHSSTFCEPVLNAQMTPRPAIWASHKHFRQKDLEISNLLAFHTIPRCYYDYEIL